MKKYTKNLCEFSASSAFKVLSILLVSVIALMAFDFDAEYLEINKTYKLNKDGSVTEKYHNKIKLYTWNATQRYFGEDFIIYNPEFQKLTINKSVTTMVDGKLVPTPANGYNEVLPRGAVGDASLTGYREMVVTHTGLERGCTIDFEYTINTKAGYYPGLMGEVVFAKSNPIKSYKLEVIVPKDMVLQFETKNGDIPFEKSEKSGNTVYTWKMADIASVIQERNQLAYNENQPKVVFSTYKNWDKLFEYFAESIDPELSVEMQQKVDELIEGESDTFEKMKNIHEYIANYTGWAKLESHYTGYKIKDIKSTYSENSGTTLDKAVLLSSMLNYAGMKSHLAFVSKSESSCDSVASLTQFDDVVVCASWHGGDKQVISPVHTSNNSLVADLGGKSVFRLNKKLKKIEKVKAFNQSANFQIMTLDLKMCKELKIAGKGSFYIGGKYNPYYSLRDNGKAGMTIASDIGELQSENETITSLDAKKSSINVDLKSNALEAKNGYIYLDLPEFSGGYDHSHIVTALTERNTTLDLHNCQSEKYVIRIKLPENVEVVSPKVKEYAKSEIGSVKINMSVEDNVLSIYKYLSLKKDKVEPTEYAEFRKMIKIWENDMFGQVVLKVEE